MSDTELIKLYLETQESRYFDRLYNKYATKVYSRCLSLLKDPGRAQDAAQEIFLKIFLNLSKFSERSQFSTWVYSITYNYCIDVIRRQKKQNAIFSDEMEKAPDLAEEVPDQALLEMEVGRLKEVLEQIPVGDKAVLLMKYQDELQIKEIASILNKTESAVKMKIKRAKHKAQSVYQSLYAEEELI
ncbi:MAG: RNA polymerase sigma factor [Phaeodactylibacter sp.]|nr:RNA polymerase sigma factor [Phaeodactylibacter sp.]